MLTNFGCGERGRFGPKRTVLGLEDAAKPIAVWNIIERTRCNELLNKVIDEQFLRYTWYGFYSTPQPASYEYDLENV